MCMRYMHKQSTRIYRAREYLSHKLSAREYTLIMHRVAVRPRHGSSISQRIPPPPRCRTCHYKSTSTTSINWIPSTSKCVPPLLHTDDYSLIPTTPPLHLLYTWTPSISHDSIFLNLHADPLHHTSSNSSTVYTFEFWHYSPPIKYARTMHNKHPPPTLPCVR